MGVGGGGGYTSSVRVVKTLLRAVQAFHADVKEGWSLFIGEWFTLKYVMGGWCCIPGGMASPSTRVPGTSDVERVRFVELTICVLVCLTVKLYFNEELDILFE